MKLTPTILRDEVYSLLRQSILSHDFPPDHRFNLDDLESQFGISRTPIKEALQRLEAEGLVEIRARRGTFVTSLNPTDIAERFDVRAILESAAAEQLLPFVQPADVAALTAINEQMRALLDHDDYQSIVPEYLALDRDFHRCFVGLAGNGQLARLHAQVNTHLAVARVRVSFSRPDSLQTQAEHRAILVALDGHDAPALQQAVEAHIHLSKQRVLAALDDD